MKVFYHNIWLIAVTFIAGMSLSSCVYDDEVDSGEGDSIRINASVINGSRTAAMDELDENRFTVLFWTEDQLGALKTSGSNLSAPYLVKEAPQSVDFYRDMVYDTGYPYPYPETDSLYATGYAPAPALEASSDYRTLTVKADDATQTARYDFLGCDLWPEVYRGSQSDPFAKEKNKLYFRHLAARLMFYADRDHTMENKQFVRHVRITNLYMSTDGGASWTPMYTPSQFVWRNMETDADGKPVDLTSSYKKTIDAVRAIEGNEGAADKWPIAGYHISAAKEFAGNNAAFMMSSSPIDRVPIYGMKIDSCYVCNPIDAASGNPLVNQPVRLKMDITAELSFSFDFPKGDPSATDDLTFTRTWPGVELGAIYEVNDKGEATTTSVSRFKPGNEYRVYIHFSRTGVNLVALQLPWNYGGVHYITIPGGDQTSTE